MWFNSQNKQNIIYQICRYNNAEYSSNLIVSMQRHRLPILQVELEELDEYISNICKQAEQKIKDAKYKTLFEVEKHSFLLGWHFREIYENIQDAKKKKQLNAEFKNIISKTNVKEVQKPLNETNFERRSNRMLSLIPTNFLKDDSDGGGLSEIMDEGSVKSEGDVESSTSSEHEEIDSPLRRSEAFQMRKNQSSSDLQKLEITFEVPKETTNVEKLLANIPSDYGDFIFSKEWILSTFQWEQEQTESAIQKYEFVPLYENDHISYISFTLNHSEYMHQVYYKSGFQNHEDENFPDINSSEQIEFIKQRLTHQQGLQQFSLKIQNDKDIGRTNYSEPSPSMAAQQFQSSALHLKQDVDADTPTLKRETIASTDKQQSSIKSEKNAVPVQKKHLEVIVYFPVQFEALRMCNNISLEQFIKSIYSMSSWDTSGGKSESKFYKSSDDLFIMKKFLSGREFGMFKQFAMEYFKHMWRLSYESKPSLLVKILGMFEIREKNTIGYYLVMENLFMGMGLMSELKVYDLKGSETNRWETKKKKVLLDTNFKVDRNGEPLSIARENFWFINRAFQNDCKFLSRQNVIDYSLLLIMDQKSRKIRLGIIDYLRFYTWDKEMEHQFKYLLKGGMVPTIVNPSDYKKRFLEAMGKYFIDVSWDQ